MEREKIHEFCYSPKDFELIWFSGTGAGGQHRNKHQNSLRLRFLPGNLEETSQSRSRQESLRDCWKRIKPRIEAWIRSQINSEEYPRNYEVIRTYNIPDNRVTDHASGVQMAWEDMEKHFGDMVEARARTEACKA
jgi:protein subunit release factor A